MTTIDSPEAALAPADDGPPSPKMRRVAAASLIGTSIEYYDFLIYGTAAALVFPAVFFPSSSPAVGTLAAFSTYAVAFFARPVGAVLFGHFGDKIGRKKTLVWTLFIMGIATMMVGFLPGYDTGVFGLFPDGIGPLAPILLVLLRFLQGFAVGGEWAGAALLTAEYAPPGKRGFYAMFPQLGPSVAFILSSGTFLIINSFIGETSDGFIQYGWRIPFILSFALVMIGLWVRLTIAETPVFSAAKLAQAKEPAATTLPFADAMRIQWREILISAGALASLFAMFYMSTAFLTSYGTNQVGHSRTFVLSVGVFAGVVYAVATAASAFWSDRVGRRTVILLSCVLAVPWSLALFPILDTGDPVLFAMAMCVTGVIFGLSFGPAGALMPELFQTRFRYTGAGMGYNLGAILGAAIPPVVATQILAANLGVMWIGIMLAVLSLVSVFCIYSIKETKGKSMA